MPPPLDLTGRRFGKLLVVARAEGKTRGGYWLCRCDCGREEIIPAWRLPYSDYIVQSRRDTLEACQVCTYTIPCKQCGAPFLSSKGSRYCSDACRKLARQEIDLRSYHEVRKVKDPDFNKKRHQQRLQKIADDPQAMAAWKQREAEYSKAKRQRLNSNPALKEKVNQRARERYIAKAEEVQARRRQRQAERLAAMTPEEREAWLANRRQKNTAWRRIHLTTMRQEQPDKYRQYLDQFNTYKRQIWRRQRALNELNRIAAELEKRSKK